MTRLELWNGDICVLEVDAIVSPSGPSLWMATGVGGALKRAGGDEIEFEAVRQGPVSVGSAVVTSAGALAARFVIHAASLDQDHRTSASAIEAAIRSAMAHARRLGVTSIAFPALGTGLGGFPLAEAAEVTVRTLREEIADPGGVVHVILALRGAEAYREFNDAFGQPAGAGASNSTLDTRVGR